MFVGIAIGLSKMSQFDAEKFMLEPCNITFYDLKKDELISLAKDLKLEVKKAMRKHHIQNIIVEHLVSLKDFEEIVLETVETSDSDLRKLQLQFEFKKLEMQERIEMEEKQRQEREQQRQFERKERKRKERLEREKKERQERMEERVHEFEMRKLELQVKLGSDPGVEKFSAKFDVTNHVKFESPFQQADVDKYFFNFEKVAGNLKWPKECLVMLLQSVLVGEAGEIYIVGFRASCKLQQH